MFEQPERARTAKRARNDLYQVYQFASVYAGRPIIPMERVHRSGRMVKLSELFCFQTLRVEGEIREMI